MANRKTAAVTFPAKKLFAPFPDEFPADKPNEAAAWVARSLLDTISKMLVLSKNFQPGDESLFPLQLTRFNRDMRELRPWLLAGYDQHASRLYGATGVQAGDWRGTCFADVAEHVGRSLHLQLILHCEPTKLADVDDVDYAPVDPDKIASEWQKVIPWFLTLSGDGLEQLGIGLLSEHRAMVPKPRRVAPSKTAKRDERFAREAKTDSHKIIVARWNAEHPSDNVSVSAVAQAIKRHRDKTIS